MRLPVEQSNRGRPGRAGRADGVRADDGPPRLGRRRGRRSGGARHRHPRRRRQGGAAERPLGGKVVLLDFLGDLVRPLQVAAAEGKGDLAEPLEGQAGFVLVGLSIDQRPRRLDTNSFRRNKLPWTQVDTAPKRAARGVEHFDGIPTTYVLDAKGGHPLRGVRASSAGRLRGKWRRSSTASSKDMDQKTD